MISFLLTLLVIFLVIKIHRDNKKQSYVEAQKQAMAQQQAQAQAMQAAQMIGDQGLDPLNKRKQKMKGLN